MRKNSCPIGFSIGFYFCMKEAAAMPKGIIKYFSEQRGYGFIGNDEINSIVVHHSQIQADGYRTLKEGEAVSFEVKRGRRGLEAINVHKIR